MARSNISIPDDLKRRMDQVEGERVNWSALACQAFESRLAEIITKQGAKDMEEVVARLRASRMKTSSKLKTAGHEAGVEWAKTSAEAEELRRIEGLCSSDWAEWLAGPFNMSYGVEECFVFAVQPENDGSRSAVDDFWGQAAPEITRPEINEDFIDGFTNGAMEVWYAVKDRL
jgi:hypothetical protein